MLRKIIIAALVIVNSAVFSFAGGVTNIKEVVNNSSKAVRVTAYDNKTLAENGLRNLLTTSVIAAGGSWRGDMWIPWADNKKQFKSHFLSLEIFQASPASRGPVLVFGGYQTGEEVRATLVRDRSGSRDEVHYLLEDEYNERAPRVDGEWKSGGDRRILFFNRTDGSVGFKFERYGR